MKLHLAHILLQHGYEAEDLLKRLEKGEVFATLAQKHSLCLSAARGGDLGEMESSRFVEEFAEAAEKLQPGQVSPVVRTRFGHHLIQRLR